MRSARQLPKAVKPPDVGDTLGDLAGCFFYMLCQTARTVPIRIVVATADCRACCNHCYFTTSYYYYYYYYYYHHDDDDDDDYYYYYYDDDDYGYDYGYDY